MRLQYQLSNGEWYDCKTEEDVEYYLTKCESNNGYDADGKMAAAFRATRLMTRDEVIAALASGMKLRNDPEDWYSECRDYEPIEKAMAARQAAAKPVEMVKCACGHTVPRSQVMNASLGTSCPDCYDRMSD